MVYALCIFIYSHVVRKRPGLIIMTGRISLGINVLHSLYAVSIFSSNNHGWMYNIRVRLQLTTTVDHGLHAHKLTQSITKATNQEQIE